ncbi:MAG: formylglycine-generating enzyme family protein [Gemmataceae bacterium]
MTRTVAILTALGVAGGVAWLVFSASSRPPEGMVWVPGGEFLMGSDTFEDTGPVHRCFVDGFWMDATEVTNAQFRRFVEATGYVTVAERVPRPEDFPGVPVEKLVPFSLVFTPPDVCPPEGCSNCDLWWKVVPGANWRHPTGPDSSIDGMDNYPVVHICFEDALAYCQWLGRRLPTEAEWEFAARGGLRGTRYYWGDELTPNGRWMANIYQGNFPMRDEGKDGFAGLAPVQSFPPNAFGLYDMAGNVWEWTADWYRPSFDGWDAPGFRRNPTGPLSSIDPHGRNERKRVQRGGSFLCADVYCRRYMAGGRMAGEITSAQNHLGFRTVLSGGIWR